MLRKAARRELAGSAVAVPAGKRPWQQRAVERAAVQADHRHLRRCLLLLATDRPAHPASSRVRVGKRVDRRAVAVPNRDEHADELQAVCCEIALRPLRRSSAVRLEGCRAAGTGREDETPLLPQEQQSGAREGQQQRERALHETSQYKPMNRNDGDGDGVCVGGGFGEAEKSPVKPKKPTGDGGVAVPKKSAAAKPADKCWHELSIRPTARNHAGYVFSSFLKFFQQESQLFRARADNKEKMTVLAAAVPIPLLGSVLSQCVKFNRVYKLLVFINMVFMNPCLFEHRAAGDRPDK